MKVVIIHGQSHKGSTYHIAHMLAVKISEDIKEFFLPRDLESFVLGVQSVLLSQRRNVLILKN